jgi:hypothetical protein
LLGKFWRANSTARTKQNEQFSVAAATVSSENREFLWRELPEVRAPPGRGFACFSPRRFAVPQTRAREVRAFSVASFALQIMTTDPFASSLASLILSWIFAIPMLAGAIGVVFSVFKKHEDVPWLFSAWMGLCFLIFGPIRYLFFLVTMASSYIFQGWLAFLTVFATGLFVTGPLLLVSIVAIDIRKPS